MIAETLRPLAVALINAGIAFTVEDTGGGIQVIQVNLPGGDLIWANSATEWNGGDGWLICRYDEPFDEIDERLGVNVTTEEAVRLIQSRTGFGLYPYKVKRGDTLYHEQTPKVVTDKEPIDVNGYPGIRFTFADGTTFDVAGDQMVTIDE